MLSKATIFILSILISISLYGQKSAVSSHFNIGKNISGDISICEVRVPADGVAFSTYYETLGFRGNKRNSTGNGYGGIQKSLDKRASNIHIFSIWHSIDDPQDKSRFPYVVHLGHGTKAEHFGGEGVGLKTWNFVLGWQPDVWYSHVVRTWDAGEHTHYGFFVRDGVNNVWRHLSTIAVREKALRMTGPHESFIEDWMASGKDMREINLRNIWRRDLNGKWHFGQSGKYSVNSWDLTAGKRSHQYKNNWNGGVKRDKDGEYFFMRTGGKSTIPTAPMKYPEKTRQQFSLKNQKSLPAYKRGKVNAVRCKKKGSDLLVSWHNDKSALPQLSYKIEIFDNSKFLGKPLIEHSAQKPSARTKTIDLENFKNKNLFLRMAILDIFDQKSKTLIKHFRNN